MGKKEILKDVPIFFFFLEGLSDLFLSRHFPGPLIAVYAADATMICAMLRLCCYWLSCAVGASRAPTLAVVYLPQHAASFKHHPCTIVL